MTPRHLPGIILLIECGNVIRRVGNAVAYWGELFFQVARSLSRLSTRSVRLRGILRAHLPIRVI